MALNFLLKRSGTASKRPTAASMALGELDLNYDASTGGIYFKDSAGTVVKVGPCQLSATAPNSTPAGSAGNSAGEFWFDTVSQTLQVWSGSAWVDATSTTDLLPLAGGTMSGDITFAGTQDFPVSGIQSASTAQPGVVQLNDTTTSTSTTEALTANQGKNLQDQIDALVVTTNITLGGTFNADTGLVDSVTAAGTTAGLVVGNALPTPGPTNEEVFVIVDAQGANGPNSPTVSHVGDWFLSDGTTWQFLNVGFAPGQATTTSQGVVQLATDAEVQAGTDPNNAVVSSSLQSKLSDSTSTTSSTTIASSTAAKTAYDAGIQGQTDAATALAAANAAGTDVGVLSSLTTTDKSSAVAAINEVNAAASAAQGDATQALSDASAAQATADQAVLDAAAAQGDATQALSDAAAAQATADAAMPKSGGTFEGSVTFADSVVGGTILTLDNLVPGDGYGFGAYDNEPLTGGTGTGATANITVSFFGGVSDVTLVDGGTGYTVGDSLSAFGFAFDPWSIEVASVTAGSIRTVTLNSGTEVNGEFTFNTSPTFTAGVDIGAAEQVTYDNAVSGLTATDVQGAIDEVAAGTPAATPTTRGTLFGRNTGNNISLGYGSLENLTTGASNTAVGSNAAVSLTTGRCNTAVGDSALGGTPSGRHNSAFGWLALGGLSDASCGNTAIGSCALFGTYSGSYNTAIGFGSGDCLGTGSFNVFIGCCVQVADWNGSCQLAIGFSPTDNWLMGTSTKAIKPGAGIIDCADSCGTAGQVLMSNGANAVCWGTAGGGSGTVTSIAAGTGLTGGTITTTGTIGLDTACVIQPTVITAKGDLITATAASTPTALPVGTDGQVLTACSTCAEGMVWQAPSPCPTRLYSGSATTSGVEQVFTGAWPAGTAAPGPGALSASVMISVCNSSGQIVDWANLLINADAPLPGSGGQLVAYLANKFSAVPFYSTTNFCVTSTNYPNFNDVTLAWTSSTADTFCYNIAITQYGGNTAFAVC